MSWLLGSDGENVPIPHAALLREDDPLDRHVLVPAPVPLRQRRPADRAQVALDVQPVLPLHLRPQLLRDQVQRLLVHRAALDRVDRALLGPRVPLQPPLSSVTIVDLPPPTGPISSRIRLRTSSRRAADAKYSTSCCSGFSTPNSSSAKNLYCLSPARLLDPGRDEHLS